jgi:hypothetical protein
MNEPKNMPQELAKCSRDLRQYVLWLSGELDHQRDIADRQAHVIVEAGVVPGEYCRCEACRSVAVAMDAAGFLEHVKDRWWRNDETLQTMPG